MKDNLKIIGILTLVCLACAFFLSLVQDLAAKKIAANAEKRISRAISSLTPDSDHLKQLVIGEDIIYELFNRKNRLIGYGFLAQGQGYQGKIKLLAVIDPSLSHLGGIEVVDSLETPGLGAKIAESQFKEQFKRLRVSVEIDSTKDIQAITGATVSSRAVVSILNKRIETLKEQISHLRGGK